MVHLSPDHKGAAGARFLTALVLGGGSPSAALEYAEKFCPSTPQVKRAFEMRMKGAIGAATTAATGWATELAQYGIGQEWFGLLQSRSLFGQVAARARRVPFHTKVGKENGTAQTGAWRSEGLPRPVIRTTTATMTQEFYSASIIEVVTRELFRFGAVTEQMVTDQVIKAVSKFVDGQMLDSSVSATTAHPASLTNGATSVTTAGTSAANLVTDWAALLANILTPGDNLVAIMRPLSYYSAVAKLGGAGMNQTPGFLFGVPVLLSSTSPQQITLLDADAIAFSFDDTMNLDISTSGSVEMLDGSLVQTGVAGTGAATVSLWQNSLVAVSASVNIAYQHVYYELGSPTQPSGVSYVTITY